MIYLGKVLSAAIKKGYRIVKYQVFKDNPEEMDAVQPFGFESNPVKDMIALVADTGVKGETVVVGYINKDVLTATGESRMFSTNTSGTLQAYLWLKNNGDILLGGDADFAVRYSKLEEAFNQLKADHNTLAQKWDAFCGSYAPGSPSTTGLPATLSTSTVGQSTADITPAKITTIKTR
jgi:hypothetical protein